jgi:hypothetical protein
MRKRERGGEGGRGEKVRPTGVYGIRGLPTDSADKRVFAICCVLAAR